MPTLAIDKGFLTDLAKLDKPVLTRVTEVFDKFDSATHTGLHEFDTRMTDVYRRALSEIGYNATYFRSMLAEFGPLAAAHKLLAAPAVSDGFAALWERGRMDLTVDAVVTEPQFAELFSADEIAVARRRLEQFGYAR